MQSSASTDSSNLQPNNSTVSSHIGAAAQSAGGPCNTPQTLTTSIDFLSFTTLKMQPQDAEEMLQAFYQDAPAQRMKRGLHGYQYGVRFPNSTWVCWSNDRPEIFVQLPGDACDETGLQSLVNLVLSTEGRVSRVDVAVDGAPFKARYLARKYREGAIRTSAQKAHFHDALNPDDYDTFELGKRSSSRFLRCYDRNFDADGNQVTRIELEFKRKRAQKVWAQITALESLEADFAPLAVGLMRDFMDVVKPTDSNISRCQLNRTWAAFVGTAAKVKTVIPRLIPDLEKAEYWLKETVSATVASVMEFHECIGHDADSWLQDLIKHGRKRMNDLHKWRVKSSVRTWETSFSPSVSVSLQ